MCDVCRVGPLWLCVYVSVHMIMHAIHVRAHLYTVDGYVRTLPSACTRVHAHVHGECERALFCLCGCFVCSTCARTAAYSKLYGVVHSMSYVNMCVRACAHVRARAHVRAHTCTRACVHIPMWYARVHVHKTNVCIQSTRQYIYKA